MKAWVGRTGLQSLHVLPQQHSRPPEVTNGKVRLPQAMGGCHLPGPIAEFSRNRQGLLARRNGARVVRRHPEEKGGCVPPFTHSVWNRAVRLMMPTVRCSSHMPPHGGT